MNNTIVLLLGYPGVGKLTVARELCALSGAKLLDNHSLLNVVFEMIDADGRTPIPDPVWDEIDVIRDAVFRSIEVAARPGGSFVLTNALIDSDAQDRPIYDRVALLAERRRALFAPVVLVADRDEILRRVPANERAANHKHIDVEGARRFMAANALLPIDHPNLSTLDTTRAPPAETAAAILAHVERIAG